MKSDREVLEEAIALLDNPSHWTQGLYACDQQGHGVESWSGQAQSWCLMGALRRVTGGGNWTEQEYRIVQAIIGFPLVGEAIQFNDSHSYDEVMLAMKRGLDNLE